MPHVPPAWLDAIFYLYPSKKDANAGARLGGTGFIVSVDFESPELPETGGFVYGVTNAHVIEGGAPVARVNLHAGRYDNLDSLQWAAHPDGDDLAICNLSLTEAFRQAWIPAAMSITRTEIEQDCLGAGDEAFFIGRYADHEGSTSNVPVARFGSIAQVGGDKVLQSERGGFQQESILVEAHSISGFSGSPVFAYFGARIGPHQSLSPGQVGVVPQVGVPLYLLGIDWGHHPWTERVRSAVTRDPLPTGEYVRGTSGLTTVVPAWKLTEMLNHPRLVSGRRNTEEGLVESLRKGGDAAAMDALANPEPTSP